MIPFSISIIAHGQRNSQIKPRVSTLNIISALGRTAQRSSLMAQFLPSDEMLNFSGQVTNVELNRCQDSHIGSSTVDHC